MNDIDKTILVNNLCLPKTWKCSHCGNKITDMKYLFCPNCGACMDEDTEREDNK